MVYDEEKRKAYQKEYRQRPKVKIMIKEYSKRPESKKYRKQYYEKNKDKIKSRRKEDYKKNKESQKEYQKKYRKKNKEKINKQKKEYSQKEDVKKRIIKYQRKRRKEDPIFNLICRLRSNLYIALKKYSKTGKIMSSKKYGIDYKAIIKHLKPFPKEICKYDVDHVIPLSYFDFNNPNEIKWAFEPENHQWLTKEENRIKGNRFIFIKENSNI